MAHAPATLPSINRPLGLAPLRPHGAPGGALIVEALNDQRERTIQTIVEQYLAVDTIPDYSDEERGAAKAALASVLTALGWLDDGRRLLAERQAAAARTMPQGSDWQSGAQWQQPESAGAIGRVPL